MSGLEIQMENRSGVDVELEPLGALARQVLQRLDIVRGELGVTFIDDREMRELNRDRMGRDGTTDVLAFPIDTGRESTAGEDMPLLLGDIIISPETARAQAEDAGTTFVQEICLLLIHGILHIAGEDHETDSGAMESLQNQLFNQLCI